MSLNALLGDYLSHLQTEYARGSRSQQATPELSYRTHLDNLFSHAPVTLGLSGIAKIYEPRSQARAGRPDWRFHDDRSMAVYGYIESKGLNPLARLNTASHKSQIERYLSLGHRVVLTDGLDFLFYQPGRTSPVEISIVEKPLRRGQPWRPRNADQLEAALRIFFASPKPQTLSTAELIKQMAAYARSIAGTVRELVTTPAGSGLDADENAAIEALREMKDLLTTAHDPELSDEGRFSDMVAQTLVFGLLYAHQCLSPNGLDPRDLSDELRQFWLSAVRRDGSNRLRPFRALAKATESGQRLGAITTWYEDCILFLANVRLRNSSTPDYHSLYGDFLRAYDPKTREDFGAYPTPKPLASFIVAFSDFIAREVFGHESIFDGRNKIIDPACGTGQFLEECVELMRASGVKPDSAPVVAGFEILPTPYALAQYRMAELSHAGNSLAAAVQIVLCNSLANYVVDSRWPRTYPQAGSEPHRLFVAEGKQAVTLSRPPITAVIGNPPSSDKKVNRDAETYGRILELIDEFRAPASERSSRQNTQKQIQNEFIKFLRWACHKLPQDDPGIFALILPGTFLHSIGYKDARAWLLSNFSDLWVVEFDGDLRAKSTGENLFATLQPRAILVGCRERNRRGSSQIKYLSLLGKSRTEKIRYFSRRASKIVHESRSEVESEFISVTPAAPNFEFRLQSSFDAKRYKTFWNLVDEENDAGIFLRHSSGIKLGITAALVHAERGILLRRSQSIGQPQETYAGAREQWFAGQRKPPTSATLTATVREEIGRCAQDSNIKPYSFRPFLTLSGLLPTPLLQRLATVGGGGTRYRPEVIAAFEGSSGNFGIAVAPGPEDIANDLHRFSSFAWNLPDNDLCARNNAHVFCLFFPEYKRSRGSWNSRPQLNLSTRVLNAVGDPSGASVQKASELLFYAYAVLCSNYFLQEFSGALFHTAGGWPRIPIPQDQRTLSGISALGKELAEIERDPSRVGIPPSLRDAERCFPTHDFPLRRFKIDGAGERIILTDDDSDYSIQPLPGSALSTKISGYNVIAEWLKWHSKPYINRDFTVADGKGLLGLVGGILRQSEIIRQIDRELQRLLSSPARLVDSPSN